VVKPSV